eukprot:m.171664 g.171664  ORF g.171664 m.171664 type:complete len:455 (+) comp14818_c0_seq5:328-1692(+)
MSFGRPPARASAPAAVPTKAPAYEPPLIENVKAIGCAKDGLVFDADFESGNLGKAESVSPHEYDLHVRPDTRNFRQRIWFYFKVRNTTHNQQVIFSVVNSSKDKSCYRQGMTPVVRSTSRPNWERLPAEACYYYKDTARKKGYVMSFTFTFDNPEDEYYFAYTFPYTYTELQGYLGGLVTRGLPYLLRERLSLTLDKRRVDLLTISAPKNLEAGADLSNVRCAFLSARVHPGETPASYVMEGLLEFLLGDTPAAVDLRDRVIFKIVPMLNPDGVVHGNYRCSSLGQDLNRCYQFPKQWIQPEIWAVRKLLTELTEKGNPAPTFYLDLHAHTASPNLFLYGNWHKREAQMERQWVFPRILAAHADDFSINQTDFNSHKAKAGTGRRALMDVMHPDAQIYTLEVSFFAYPAVVEAEGGRNGTVDPPNPPPYVPYTQRRYREVGETVGRAMSDYFGS